MNPSERYSRQTLFGGIGVEGQARLGTGRCAVIGCGALGSVLANTLVRAGVGFVRIVDRDFVDLSNLQRQVLFNERDVQDRLPKAEAARRRLSEVNSEIEIEAVVEDVDATNVLRLVDDVDVILDGSDNFALRYLVNDASLELGIPWIYGAAVGSYGLTMTIRPHETPCLRCVFPSPPPAEHSPTCDTAGVLGPIINMIASVQACEAIKLLAGKIESLSPYLLQMDVWDLTFRPLKIANARQGDSCPACGHGQRDYLRAETRSTLTTLCGRNAIQISHRERRDVDLEALARKLAGVGEVERNAYLLRLKTPDHEITVFRDGRAIVGGTDDAAAARSLYARFIGD